MASARERAGRLASRVTGALHARPSARLAGRLTILTRNPDFARLWVGESLAEGGSQLTLIAMPLLALSITHSAADAGLIGVARTAAIAGAVIPGGVLADRMGRRKLMIGCTAVRIVSVASVPVTLALARPPLAQLVAVSLLEAAAYGISYVAERSLLPQIVAAEEIPDAVAANEARSAAAVLAGPPVGGALFGLARAAPFLADASSAAAAAAALATMRRTMESHVGTRRAVSARVAFAEAADGFRWLLHQPFLRAGSMLYAAENVTLYGVNLLGILVLRRHGVSSAGIGAAYALVGAGGLLSAALAGPLRLRLPERAAILLEPWVYVAMLPLLLVFHSVLGVGLIIAAMLVPMTLSTTIIVGRRLTMTPDRLRGRVQASGAFLAVSLAWLGPLAIGLLVQHDGERSAVLAISAWALLTAVAATASPALRTPPQATVTGDAAGELAAEPDQRAGSAWG